MILCKVNIKQYDEMQLSVIQCTDYTLCLRLLHKLAMLGIIRTTATKIRQLAIINIFELCCIGMVGRAYYKLLG